MSPPLWALSLPIGSMMIFVPRFISIGLQIKSGVPLKASSPRDQVEGEEVAVHDTHGYVRRAYASHQNSWESMILWSTAVLLANATGVDTDTMNISAGLWLAARVAYIPSYILVESNKKAVIRQLVFLIGLISTLSLMWEAALTD